MSQSYQKVLKNERAMAQLAKHIAPLLSQQITHLHLQGPLGVGKTTLVRKLLRAWGYEGSVKSPTYTLVETYDVMDFTLVHLDLYRLQNPLEIENLGLDEVFQEGRVMCIEWPCEGLPPADLLVNLDFLPERVGRQVVIYGNSTWGNNLLTQLSDAR